MVTLKDVGKYAVFKSASDIGGDTTIRLLFHQGKIIPNVTKFKIESVSRSGAFVRISSPIMTSIKYVEIYAYRLSRAKTCIPNIEII